MEDFATRFADLLEMVATRIRSLTVDRVNRWIRVSSLGMVAVALGLMAAVFLVLTIFGALAIPLGNAGAFGVLGAIALIGGVFLWNKQHKTP
ncbi:hypothetical protein BH18ACT6_BH18ACT6_14610 [soil metagenome]|nr:hypothetical protein [Actinomycetota bacterium]